jgi:hypothetical protein
MTLTAIERELRVFISSRLLLRAAMPEEVAALAKIREAMALLAEARIVCDAIDNHRYVLDVPRYTPPELQEKVRRLK